MLRDSNNDIDIEQESSKKKQRKSKSKEGIVNPNSSKSVNHSDKGKMVEEEEFPAPIVRRSLKGKIPSLGSSTQSKISTSEKKKKKKAHSDGGELTGTILEIVVELPQQYTPELRVKKMKNSKTSEKADKVQTSKKAEKHTQKVEVTESMSQKKTKKSRLFQDNILTPNKKYGESSAPTCQTTRSMEKQVMTTRTPSFLENLVDVSASPEKEHAQYGMLNEIDKLVTETLKELRKSVEANEETTKHEIVEPSSSLNRN